MTRQIDTLSNKHIPHGQDPLFVYKDHNYIAESVEAVGSESYPTGDRMSTLMFYLSSVQARYPAFSLAVYTRTFPCMEANYPYDIKNQRVARNSRG